MDKPMDLTIVRTLDTPRGLVWKAWTDPKLVRQWWGPRGVTNPVCKLDARPGGQIEIVMLAGKGLGPFEGKRWPMKGAFTELAEPERIVFTASAIDEEQRAMIETETTVTLEDLSGKTKMTVHIRVKSMMDTPAATGAISGMQAGWNQSIDKLSEFLATYLG